MEELPTRLLTARDFVEVAIAACEVCCARFDLYQCAVTLHDIDGAPRVMVDNIPNVSDDYRLVYMREVWRLDPMLAALLQYYAPAGDDVMEKGAMMELAERTGYTGASVHRLLLPLVQLGPLLGVLRCGRLQPFTAEQRRDLITVSTQVSVRLAQLRVTNRVDPIVAKLTPRQRDVVRLASRGHRNIAIGAELGLSENTVKKHLKDVFEIVDVGNRTELAARLALAGDYSAPVGVSRRGELAITRPL